MILNTAQSSYEDKGDKQMKIHKTILRIIAIYLLSLILILVVSYMRDARGDAEIKNGASECSIMEESQQEVQHRDALISFIPMNVPDIDSSFKTYMAYQVWERNKATNSAQYKFFKRWGWVDSQGFVRCSAEKDLGIPEDYYMVALGSYYGTTLGTKYKITLDTGRVFYAILGEFKANIHTNSTNQYSLDNNDIVEFVVDENKLKPNVKQMGSANVYMPLSGKVVKIERIDFEPLK